MQALWLYWWRVERRDERDRCRHFGSIGRGWRGEMRETDAGTLALLVEGGEER